MLIFCQLICYRFFKKVNDSHNYNTRNNNNKFKVRFTRTTQQAGTICVEGPKLWNVLNIDVKLCKTTVQFNKKNIKLYYWRHIKHELVHVTKYVIELHFYVVSL